MLLVSAMMTLPHPVGSLASSMVPIEVTTAIKMGSNGPSIEHLEQDDRWGG